MRRPALYSRSSSSSGQGMPEAEAHAPQNPFHDNDAPAATQAQAPDPQPGQSAPTPTPSQHLRLLWATVGLLALALAFSLFFSMQPPTRRLTQKDINAAVLNTLQTTVLPSPGLKAYEAIIPSVVRVTGLGKVMRDRDGGESVERSVGTGVVIVDKGVILTNLHVVRGAQTIRVTFADGLESGASITGVQPDNDLAVLQAHKIPDDLPAATLRSTAGLAPGEQVMAVGYPFGIGPSASSGVISGLGRTFRSPEGKQLMSNLIQFDAAANPGNSGGPLVTMDGEVIGIVTAIYNPNQQKSFVGIGFAVPIESAAAAAGMPPF